MSNFRIKAIPANNFSQLFTLSKNALTEMGAVRLTADSKPGFPCRISLEDAEIGEEVILLNYLHHDCHSPYRASGPIYIRNKLNSIKLKTNDIPRLLSHRLLSMRAYNKNGMMIDAHTINGKELRETINLIFNQQEIEYIHIHNASPGCYNCLVERV